MNHTVTKEQSETGTANYVRGKILVVDDDPSVRNLLRKILESDAYFCELAENAVEAMDILKKHRFDLVISDVVMPGKNGVQLLSDIRARYPSTQILMISGYSSEKTAESALSMGASDFLLKPFQKNQVLISVSNAIRRRAIDLQNQFELKNLENIIYDQTRDLHKANERLNKILESTIKAMSMTVESRDPYTAGHQERVANIAAAIAVRMNFSEEHLCFLKMACLIHDIGKLSVPAEILCKPSRLSDAEFNIMKEHSITGYKILKEIEFPYPLAQIVHQHHERMDGSGYPQNLHGDQILPEARILAVADVVEAMGSHRPYRPALGIGLALDEIRKNKGRLFDPEVVTICCDLFESGALTLN